MGRGLKITIAAVAVLAALVGLNALSVDREAKPAEVNVAGARIVSLPGGDLQVLDKGPRSGTPIVLIHCFTCSIGWWDEMRPRLQRGHRVIAVDLLGHGGSEKPTSGYSIPNQADLVAQALARLDVSDAVVVGHSLGGAVAVALSERSPALVDRLAVIGSPPDHSEGDLGFVARLGFTPVIGEALWRIKPDFAVRDGLGVAFAPGFEVPDAFVDDVNRMTYSAYSSEGFDDYTGEKPLSLRAAASGKPLLAIIGAEEQIIDDPQAALRAYADAIPGAQTELIPRAGHSPNVETPALTARLVLAFADRVTAPPDQPSKAALQDRMQNRKAVRGRP